ncbi:hypothetical protein D9M71_802370 [compost metagenome]
MLIFLDGSKVREDVVIAKMIGEHWNSVVTEGKGIYFNCNAKKSNYKFCGVGMINHFDLELRENLLRKAVIYITKPDYYKKIVVPGNGRAFGKGVIPKMTGARRGRPRRTPALQAA